MTARIKVGQQVRITGGHLESHTAVVLSDHGSSWLVEVEGLTVPCRPRSYYVRKCGCQVPLVTAVQKRWVSEVQERLKGVA